MPRRYGELEQRWTAYDTWTYASTFDAPAALLAEGAVDLVLSGVDTYATVTLNGHEVGELGNFHREHRLDVKDALKGGTNELSIAIRPALKEAQTLSDASPYPIPSLTQLGGFNKYNFVRKPASDFGWDWGPAFSPSGIHHSVALVGYSAPRLLAANVQQFDSDDAFMVKVLGQFRVPDGVSKGTLRLAMPELGVDKQTQVTLKKSQEPTEFAFVDEVRHADTAWRCLCVVHLMNDSVSNCNFTSNHRGLTQAASIK